MMDGLQYCLRKEQHIHVTKAENQYLSNWASLSISCSTIACSTFQCRMIVFFFFLNLEDFVSKKENSLNFSIFLQEKKLG
jgi:hypothetical protein